MVLSPQSDERRRMRRNIRLGSLGAGLENYDFVVYLYVATLISRDFFPAGSSATLRLAQTFAIYAIGFLIRPVAGILIARIADQIGRKRLFVLNVMAMSVATVATGLLPTYVAIGWLAPVLLILMRVIQGCAMGGELPAAAVFVSEHAPRDGVARAGSFQQMVTFIGQLCGAGVAFLSGLIVTNLTPDTPSLAWRLPFLVGGVLGIVSTYLRRKLDETPVFTQRDGNALAIRKTPVREVFRKHYRAALFGALIVSTLVIGNTAYISFWPTYLQISLHIPATKALMTSFISILGALLLMPFWGRVADRRGWRTALLCAATISTVGSVLLLTVLPALPADSSVIYWIGLPGAIGSGASIAMVPGLVSSLFPAEVRQTGYSVSYNLVIATIGGVLGLIMVGLVSLLGVGTPMYVALLGALISVIAAVVVVRLPRYLGVGARPTNDTGTRAGDAALGSIER
ncbi:MFS transporter [Amycolatopsis pithecellobii]|uniref:MFS transporter n=1 Tax=Amycolatopsis pithecellobii TaxID=664692 RepID=A0A6N7ZBM3_9PSEU|nr:MFS transporter [Amycolatopsis pithecellobii]MTD59130.1 MFS transporter [Amycolatopsis pithecellobii]